MRCVIIAGSPETSTDFIKKLVKSNDYVICADKGYLFAKNAGITPDLVVGDFDSYNEQISDNCEIITLNPHKDDTDTVHSIDVAFEKGYRDFVITGALGGRTDHSIANISALEYIYSKGGRGVLVSEKERVEFLSIGNYIYKGCKGKTFSVFPFGCDKVCVSEQGAEYPLDRYYIKSSIPLGISNVFTSDESRIDIYDGNAILIINLSED
ncbi:MAG: thiamine diphosphokinase [Ruminococcus sp.]|nr:thiamine diphosphokinase [Ruminococcus sp.]